MRIVAAMHLANWLRINVTRFGTDKNAIFKMSFKNALQCDEERCAIVAVIVGPALGYDLRRVDLHLCLWVLRA